MIKSNELDPPKKLFPKNYKTYKKYCQLKLGLHVSTLGKYLFFNKKSNQNQNKIKLKS